VRRQKKHPEKKSGQVVFDSEGSVAGMGWKTYALCVGVYVFSFLIAVKFSSSVFFQAGI